MPAEEPAPPANSPREPRTAGRRSADAGADDARELLSAVEDLAGIRDTGTLLDRLAAHACRLARYECGLLSLALPEGALVGVHNLPAEDAERFRRRAGRTHIDYRLEKRRRIRRYAFPGTGICFVPHGEDLDRAPLSDAYHALPRPPGTWHPRDRLFLFARGAGGREIGTFSLDRPEDGNAPDARRLDRLLLAERLLAVGGHLVENRILESVLRRGEEEMRALVEDAPVGIYRRLEGGGLLSANARLAALLGYRTPEELLRDPAAAGRLEPEGVAAEVDALPEGRDVLAREIDARGADGRTVRLRITWRRLPARGYVLGIVEDVTEAVRLQTARRLESLGTLASGIAHDFNNILAGILGYASLLRERAGNDASIARPAVSIEEAALRGADLARRLLRSGGAGAPEAVPVDPAGILSDCARIARETFDRRIVVETEFPADLPAVKGRETDLHQAVLNLCINARDAMPEGGRLRLAAARDPRGPSRPPAGPPPAGWIRIDVEDGGEGIEAAVLPRIFEPFFTTKRRGKGTGLGLYMVYTTLETHGGTVEVDSSPGRGTRFRLYLPEAPGVAPPPPGPPAPAVPAAPPAAAPARILLVEDEGMIRDLATAILAERGHRVLPATDGARAVEILADPSIPLDLVILDLRLPRLSGTEVFRRVADLRPGLPVILCSGNLEEGLLDGPLRRGLAGILPKPYRAAELVAAVDRALSGGAPAP